MTDQNKSGTKIYDTNWIEHLLKNSPAILYARKFSNEESRSGDSIAVYVSENIRSKFGYSVKEALSNPGFWQENIHPDDLQNALSNMSELPAKKHITHEYRFKRKDGEYRWIRDELFLFTDISGNPNEIIGSWMDITERKKTEAALEDNRQLLAKIVEAIPNLIYIFDLETFSIEFMNRHKSGISGYSIKELDGMGKDYWSRIIFIEDIGDIKKILNKWKKAKDSDVLSFEFRIKTKSGETRWLSCINRVFKRKSRNQVKKIIGSVWDVTEFRRTREKFEEKNIALKGILSSIEHEKSERRKKISEIIHSEIIPLVSKLKGKGTKNRDNYYKLLLDKLKLIGSKDESAFAQFSGLTKREYEICQLLRENMTAKEISEKLNITPATLKKHRENIRRKLNLTNRHINLRSFLKNAFSV